MVEMLTWQEINNKISNNNNHQLITAMMHALQMRLLLQIVASKHLQAQASVSEETEYFLLEHQLSIRFSLVCLLINITHYI